MSLRRYIPAVSAALVMVCLGGAVPARAAGLSSFSLLDEGYRDMYNLQFDQAHRSFADWERLHPQDPMGPASDAAAYLFSEFNRLHVLQFELFSDNNKLARQPKLPPDPHVKQAFEARLGKARELADAALRRDPGDANARFTNILVLGLRGDYTALIEKRYLAGFSLMNRGRLLAEQLLTADPGYYDAYLAVGIENYLLSLKPAPIRWMLRLSGAETDKAAGIEKLKIVAIKGHYMLPYARLLLAVAALRDNNRDQARNLLQGLARDFPRNQLYTQELAQLEQPAR